MGILKLRINLSKFTEKLKNISGLIAPIIGKEAAIVSIPILNGGIVATQIMTKAAMEKGFALAAALGTILYAI